MSGSRVLVLPLMIDLVTWKSDTMNAIQKAMFNNHPIPRSAINHNKYKLCTINELPKKYSSHLWHEPLTAKQNTAPNHIQRNCTRLCTESTLRDPCGCHSDIRKFKRMNGSRYQHIPVYRPPTDHLRTTYHLLNTYQPPTNTYWTVTDHLPTTFLLCSLYMITISIL